MFFSDLTLQSYELKININFICQQTLEAFTIAFCNFTNKNIFSYLNVNKDEPTVHLKNRAVTTINNVTKRLLLKDTFYVTKIFAAIIVLPWQCFNLVWGLSGLSQSVSSTRKDNSLCRTVPATPGVWTRRGSLAGRDLSPC